GEEILAGSVEKLSDALDHEMHLRPGNAAEPMGGKILARDGTGVRIVSARRHRAHRGSAHEEVGFGPEGRAIERILVAKALKCRGGEGARPGVIADPDG